MVRSALAYKDTQAGTHELGPDRPLSQGASPKGRWEQMVGLFREHGATFVALYTGSYAACVGAAWAALSVAKVDSIALMRRLGSDRVIDLSEWSPGWVNAAVATVIADFAEPVRLPLVVAATPALGRMLRRGR